jgi:two-component system CheB/CheR fusion protein
MEWLRVQSGHDFSHYKRATVLRRIERRMQVNVVPTVPAYLELLRRDAEETPALLQDMLISVTNFFRDGEAFHALERELALLHAGRPAHEPVRAWVAGCATGEEAYTLAMIGRRIGRDLWVMATDVNETALAAARRGVYSALAVRDVPEFERHWVPQREEGFVVDDALRAMVRFQRHNLVDPPPQAPRGAWDLVVCRNVLIYFAPSAARGLLVRFARVVREGGALIVGASEVVFEPPPGLDLVSSDNRLVLRRPMRPPLSLPQLAPPPAGLSAVPPVHTPASMPAGPPPPLPASATAPIGPSAPPPTDEMVADLSRGHAMFERGDIAAAVEVYDALARGYPSIAEVWLFLGIARYAHGDVEDAATALRASLCLDTALWPATFYLARSYERLGRRADALQQYDQIAVDDLPPFSLQSTSAVINELRAFRHDFRNAAKRLSVERTPSPRRPFR